MSERKLTPKQAAFVREYLVDLNAKQAAIRAGFSAKTAEQQSYQLLQKTLVQAAIAESMARREQRTEITQDRVLKEYARLAFFDARKLFDEAGRPIPISNLDDDTAAAIVGLDVCTIGNQDVGFGEALKYKLADKKGALDSVARHLGMFNDKLELSGSVELASRLARAKKALNGEG